MEDYLTGNKHSLLPEPTIIHNSNILSPIKSYINPF